MSTVNLESRRGIASLANHHAIGCGLQVRRTLEPRDAHLTFFLQRRIGFRHPIQHAPLSFNWLKHENCHSTHLVQPVSAMVRPVFQLAAEPQCVGAEACGPADRQQQV